MAIADYLLSPLGMDWVLQTFSKVKSFITETSSAMSVYIFIHTGCTNSPPFTEEERVHTHMSSPTHQILLL